MPARTESFLSRGCAVAKQTGDWLRPSGKVRSPPGSRGGPKPVREARRASLFRHPTEPPVDGASFQPSTNLFCIREWPGEITSVSSRESLRRVRQFLNQDGGRFVRDATRPMTGGDAHRLRRRGQGFQSDILRDEPGRAGARAFPEKLQRVEHSTTPHPIPQLRDHPLPIGWVGTG